MLLFLAFGSVVLPVKAMVMNVLSLAASFGVIVWIFQDGHLSGLLGLHLDRRPRGDPADPHAGDRVRAVDGLRGLPALPDPRAVGPHPATTPRRWRAGLQRTGRIITSAALLLVVVIGAFALSGIMFIKMIGVGMAVAIVVDATVVRALLVPATMRLLGRWNWWAPAPLRRLHDRIGLREPVDEPDPAFAQDGDGTLDVPVERAGNRRNGAEVVQ